MPALDIFSGSAFSMVALTDAINKMPFVPGRIGQLGLFREQGVSTTSVMIEEREGSLTLVETTSRGAPAVQHVANKRKARSLTAPLAGACRARSPAAACSACSTRVVWLGGGRPRSRYADAAVFEHAPRYHGGGFAGSGLLPDEVPIIARRGELVVPPERIVREEKTAREQRPITVVVNVTTADASSFRASQGQIAADMARAIDRASRNR
jgi:hypothetical protein